MVGILAQVDDIFSLASRGEKLTETRWGMRIQGHGYLNILCRCNIRRSARGQREHGFLLDQHYSRCGLILFVCPLDKKIRSCIYWGFTPGKCVHCAWFQELNRTASW